MWAIRCNANYSRENMSSYPNWSIWSDKEKSGNMCTVRTEDSENGAVCMCNCVKHETLCDVVILRSCFNFSAFFPRCICFSNLQCRQKSYTAFALPGAQQGYIYYVFKMSANIDMKKVNAVKKYMKNRKNEQKKSTIVPPKSKKSYWCCCRCVVSKFRNMVPILK